MNSMTARQLLRVKAPATLQPIRVVICVVIDRNTRFSTRRLAAKGRTFNPVADPVMLGEK